MVQPKIISFFKPQHDPDEIQSGGDLFAKTVRSEVVVTYKARDLKHSDSNSDYAGFQPVPNEAATAQKANESSAVASSESGSSIKFPNRKKRRYVQLHLELGQSDFLLHTCSLCGFVYARGEEEDEKLHKAFHKDYSHGIQFKGWRNERFVFTGESNGDRVVLLENNDSLKQKQKVNQVVKIIEKELGFDDATLLHKHCQVYLFISKHRVEGCLIAEPIKEAHRVISESSPCKNSDSSRMSRISSSSLRFGNIKFEREIIRKDGDSGHGMKRNEWDNGAILCEEEAVPALCGVRAIWVAPCKRRNRVASKLLDAVRKSFFPGRELDSSQCAFSSPTSAGKAFASSYSGSQSFLIYRT